ncbi:large multi-functional protein [Rhodopirellula europaea 6C]|uniref:Large multi-functional protein n=2 Tax=Rhodopirellula TaxID=265488 RepID=M2A372_9BACT|nr:large multi-functional protein [Rhodopirellula europaea 6C]
MILTLKTFLMRMHLPVPNFLAGLFVVFWCVAGVASVSAQEPAADDPDLELQGEYVAEETGVQVIAIGDGEFDVVIHEGGLPGAGAKPSPRKIEADEDVLLGLFDSMNLRRVERVSSTMGRSAPAKATVLFDGTKDSAEANWENGRVSSEGWLMQGTTSKHKFQDYTLHLEFRTPFMPKAKGQQRGNSGVYHQGRYETQVLDSFGLEGLDNECGAIYTVSAPAVNVCYPPMQWQTYDVDFTAARFDDAGKKVTDARMTVRLNGVIVQNNVVVPNATRGAKLKEGPEPGPIYLQDHGNQVRYRNIWVLPRDAEREAKRPIVSGFERFVGTDALPMADAGEVLIDNLACGACHAAGTSMLPSQSGPDLSQVFGRVRVDAIVDMIADPHATKRGTTMPDPWPGMEAAERRERAKEIASYLHSINDQPLEDRIVSDKLADRGEKLYQKVGCAACHSADPTSPSPMSVPLGKPHRKYTLPSLTKFLKTCNQLRPGLRMPAMVGTDEEIMAVAAYLTREVTVGETADAFTRTVYHGSWDQLPTFDSLDPVSKDQVSGLKFDDLKRRNNFAIVYETDLHVNSDTKLTFYLASDDGSALEIDGHRLENDGIHPHKTVKAEYELKAGVYPVRVEYFDGGGQTSLSLEVESDSFARDDIAYWVSNTVGGKPLDLLPSEFAADSSLIEKGKRQFYSAGCANCHSVGEENASDLQLVQALALDQASEGKGCLADEVSAPAVNFALGASQTSAIESALKRRRSGQRPKVTDARRVHMTMVGLNCYACHQRDGVGGPELSRDESFVSTVPEMGLEGRLPPQLTGVGDKLTPQTITDVLNHGANLRSYMGTRMPAFAYEPLRDWHAAVGRLDMDPTVEEADTTASESTIVSNGRELCGNDGLACIKCHSFGGDTGGGLGAIDLLTMPKRLRYEWFQRYLQNPTLYRPGTRMPNSFVDGKSAITTIEDGDPVNQTDAIWKYLSLGDKAKEPVGLKQDAIVLQPTEQALRIYRNFFTGVSARGIGIAFPNKTNLIWDAEQMTLARVWRNGFFDASMHWRGRGQGRQEPLGDAVAILEGQSTLAQLPSIAAAWPEKSARARDFRFGGYQLSGGETITIGFAQGDLKVEDTISSQTPAGEKQSPRLSRTLTISVPAANGSEQWVWQPTDQPMELVEESKGTQVFRVSNQTSLQIQGIRLEQVTVDGKAIWRAGLPAGEASTIQQTIAW